MTTLQRFYDIDMYKMSDDVVNKVVSSDSLWSNKRIFNGLISSTKNDNQLLGLSFLVERLATGDLLICDCPNIESFRNG